MNPAAPRRRLPQGWLRSFAMTLGFGLLVAGGVADQGTVFPYLVIGVAALGLGTLYLLFPHGLHVAFGTSAGLAVYACLFAVMGRAAFPLAPDLARAVAFLLPVVTFLAAVWWRRRSLRLVAEQEHPFDLGHLPRMARWLIPVWAVGAFSLALPVNRLPMLEQGTAIIAAMGVIALVVAASVRGVVLLLTDMALITEELAGRAARILVPIVAFLAMYAMLVVVFACFYRIAQGLSLEPLFHGPQGPVPLPFPDALYFSLITQATVGYGDLTPHDDGIRLLASIQVIAGQVLLLFGFAEIMRTRRALGADHAARRQAD
ncbi:two pore domain potassium channel family protein [Roseomonas sp. PWR1]|uniref:Two pore domain potassium channel family protein n=1 Tax=Roseomonas nitratireducens TaxID=2820810 RepID=A0ABS4ATV0_9PROT|nr:two pore domain potassium channel family protein [Neoroseomonas nitratireducens]